MSIVDKNNKEVIRFTEYMDLHLFARRIFYGSTSLKKVGEMQDEMESKIEELKRYKPKIQEKLFTNHNS